MSERLLPAGPAANPGKVGCLIVHRTPEQLSIDSTFSAGRWKQLLRNLVSVELLLVVGIPAVAIAATRYYRGDFPVVLTIISAIALGLALCRLVLEFVLPIRFLTRDGTLTWRYRAGFREASCDFEPSDLVLLDSRRVREVGSFFAQWSLVAVTPAADEIVLFRGTRDETDFLAGRLREELQLEAVIEADPPAGARFYCLRTPRVLVLRSAPRRRPILLLLVFLITFPIAHASLGFLDGKGTADAWPILIVVATVIALILVGITHELLSRCTGSTVLCLNHEGLLVAHRGFRPATEFLPLEELSHFAFKKQSLLARALPPTNPDEAPLPPIRLLTHIRPQDATFLLQQLTSTLTTLKNTP